MNNNITKSDSILKKRIRRFKSIKRGYYSFILLVTLYLLSFFAPILVNSKALLVCYSNNQYDQGEDFIDDDNNTIWDIGESFQDNKHYYFPAVSDLFGGIFYNKYYEAKFFGQDSVRGLKKYGKPNYRILQKSYKKQNTGNFVIMPFYPFDPIEEVLSERDELFIDENDNSQWDISEQFFDENNNGIYDTYNPATFPDIINILGTDNQGRDVFARLFYGFNVTLTFALFITLFAYIIGILVGGILGYFGGKTDLFGVRIIEIFYAIPFLFLMMILSQILKPNVIILAMMYVFIVGWIGISLYIRGEFFREKSKDYVSAAVSMGQSTWKIMFKHILPNALTPIITFAPFAIIAYIYSLVALDFLGFGLQPPTPSWGELLNQGRLNLQYWHLILVPLTAIASTLFLITFIGEAVREAFDPKIYSRLR
jgi:microcin C transport system permease protein